MLVAPSCPTLCKPIDCSPPSSSIHGIPQARILEWVAIPFSRGCSWLRDWTRVSCMGRWILYHWASREAQILPYHMHIYLLWDWWWAHVFWPAHSLKWSWNSDIFGGWHRWMRWKWGDSSTRNGMKSHVGGGGGFSHPQCSPSLHYPYCTTLQTLAGSSWNSSHCPRNSSLKTQIISINI